MLRSVGFTFAFAAMVVSISGCSRSKPARQPSIDPSAAGSGAMKLYDTNGDGKVAGDELEKAPSLKEALPRLDTNKDGGVSADEVAERVNTWKQMGTAMVFVSCTVTLDGKPLPGAKVIFEPESFLGSDIKTAFGTTNEAGQAGIVIPPEDRPDPTLPGGIQFGLYKVRITKDGVNIPARYNTETILGQEVAYDAPSLKNETIVFALKK